MKQTWKQMHIWHLKYRYQRKADEWKGIERFDDRRVYCNIYRRMLEALESLPDEPHNYVCCAMNHKMSEDREVLDRILEVFKDR